MSLWSWSKCKKLSPTQVARGAEAAYRLDAKGPLQFRESRENGFKVATFKDTRKRREEHDRVREKLLASFNTPGAAVLYGSGGVVLARAAVAKLGAGFEQDELCDALKLFSVAPLAASISGNAKCLVQSADALRRKGAPPQSQAAAAGAARAKQASSKTLGVLSNAYADYRALCVPCDGDTPALRQEKKAFAIASKNAFKQNPLTRHLELTSDSLSERLTKPQERIEALQAKLTALTHPGKGPRTAGSEKLRAEQIQRCSEELMTAIADWGQSLGAAGQELARLALRRSAFLQRPLARYAAALTAQGQVVFDQDGEFMAMYRRAEDLQRQAKDQLARFALRDTAEQVIKASKQELKHALAGSDDRSLWVQVPGSGAMHPDTTAAQLEQQVKEAGHIFDAMVYATGSATLAGADPQAMQEEIEKALSGHRTFAALNSEGGRLGHALLVEFPAVLQGFRTLAEQATAAARAEGAHADQALQQRAVDANRTYMRALDRYTQMLATAAHVLANEVNTTQWSTEQRARLQNFAFKLLDHAKGRNIAGSEHRLEFIKAQTRYREAQRKLAVLSKQEPTKATVAADNPLLPRRKGLAGLPKGADTPRRNLPRFDHSAKPAKLRSKPKAEVQKPATEKHVRFAETPTAADPSLPPQGKKSKRMREPRDAQTVLTEFQHTAFTPRNGADALDASQQRLHASLTTVLQATYGPDAPQATDLLERLHDMRQRIRALEEGLEGLAQGEAVDANLLDVAGALLMEIDAYLENVGRYAHIFQTLGSDPSVPDEWRTSLKEIADAMNTHGRVHRSLEAGSMTALRNWTLSQLNLGLQRPEAEGAQSAAVPGEHELLSPRSALFAEIERELVLPKSQ